VMKPEDLEVIAAAVKGSVAGATESLQVLVLDLLGGAAKELGAELTLMVQDWRSQRALRLGRGVTEKLKGRPRRAIALNVLMPAFEYAVLEDREELLNLWVQLLASAGTAGADEVDRLYVEILKDLTPLDARFLQWVRHRPPDLDANDPRALHGAAYTGPLPGGIRPRAERQAVVDAFGLSDQKFELMASRLERLGLCDVGRWIVPTRMGTSGTGPKNYDAIALRPLGVAFVDACRVSPSVGEPV